MKKTILLLLLAFAIGQSKAQELNLHLNIGTTGFAEGEVYPTFGLGIEAIASNRWTVFGEFEYGRKTNDVAFNTAVDRNIFSMQPGVKYYFKEAMRGFNLSFFGTYARQTIDASEQASVPLFAQATDRTGIGLGLGYMARLKNGFILGFDTGLANSFEDDDGRLHFRLQMGYSF